MITCLRNIFLFPAKRFVVWLARNRVASLRIMERITFAIRDPFCLYLYTSEENDSLTDKCVFSFDTKIPCLVRLQAKISDLLICQGA